MLTVQPHMQQLLTEQLAACYPCKTRESVHRITTLGTV
jgi:hypothetical protein